jgi:hypothetical protein
MCHCQREAIGGGQRAGKRQRYIEAAAVAHGRM